MGKLRKIFGFIILISLLIIIGTHIKHPNRGVFKGWGYTYPVFAQQKFDLSCPAGVQPFQPLITNNPQTGNLKANVCIDNTGLLTWNGLGGSGTLNGSGPPVGACTNGQIYTDNNTGNLYACNQLVWQLVGPAQAGNANLINPSALGVLADGKVFYGISSNISITAGSSIITCNNCNFSNADSLKLIEATTGCCGGQSMFNGVLSIAITQITSVINSTSVSIAPATAIISCTVTCVLGYGTNDDIGWTAVDNAINSSVNCSTIVFPFGYSFIKEPHFQPFSGSHLCESSSSGHDYNYRFLGGGPYTSVMILQSDFDWAACLFGTSNKGCFLSYTQELIDNLGFTGLGYGNTGNHTKVLIYPGQGTQISDDSFYGFAGSDTSAVGISFQSGTRGKFINCDGFGGICGQSTTIGTAAWNYCFWCFFGDNLTNNFKVIDNRFIDYGSEYGVVAGSGSLLIIGSEYDGYGSSLFAGGLVPPTGSGGVGIYIQGGQAKLYGGSWDNSNSINGNGAAIQNGAASLYATGVTFKGSGTGGSVNRVSGTYFDGDNNTYSSATLGLAPTCTVTGAGATGTCASDTGNTNEKGTLLITAAGAGPAANGTIVLTFQGVFSGGNAQPPTCQWTLDDTGNTSWNPRATIIKGASSTASVTVNWDNNAIALVATNTLRVGYSCIKR